MTTYRKSDRSGLPASSDQSEESEPDVRFTYANERTFLAWFARQKWLCDSLQNALDLSRFVPLACPSERETVRTSALE
jgi:hypothetical protein